MNNNDSHFVYNVILRLDFMDGKSKDEENLKRQMNNIVQITYLVNPILR